MSELGAKGRGEAAKRGGDGTSHSRGTTWDSWREQGLPLGPIHRKFKNSGRIQDADWVVPRIQRHLHLHPEPTTGSSTVHRKIFRAEQTPPSPGTPQPNARSEQWCRNSISTVQALDVQTRGSYDSFKTIADRHKAMTGADKETPAYRDLATALSTKGAEFEAAGNTAIASLLSHVQRLPPRPPAGQQANAAGGSAGSGGPGGAPTAAPSMAPAGAAPAPTGRAGMPQTVPGQQQGPARGLRPALPPGMTPQQLQALVGQRNAWLADPRNQQRVDPNAANQQGLRIRGQNTTPNAQGNVTAGNEGHVMATNNASGAHSSFSSAADRSNRTANAEQAGLPHASRTGTFRPPFPNGALQDQHVMTGGNRNLANDPYLEKPMDFDFTLSQGFVGAHNPNGMRQFDQAVNSANGREQRLRDDPAPMFNGPEHAAGEFRLGTAPVQPNRGPDGQPQEGVSANHMNATNRDLREASVSAVGPNGARQVPTVQAQNCGTELMKTLLNLKILDTTDLAMLGADPRGNFLPNCDLTPQALADHLRWKQAEWQRNIAAQRAGRS